jgi:hypothetical protein
MADYRLAANGVIRTSDGAFIPTDTRNRDWNAYLAWAAVPNTPDPIPVPVLADYQASAIARVNAMAESLAAATIPGGPARALYESMRFAEAVLADADGTPTSGEYPLLNDEAVALSSTIAARADVAIADRDSIKDAMGAIEAVRLAAVAAIDDATDNDEVDDAIDAITWP